MQAMSCFWDSFDDNIDVFEVRFLCSEISESLEKTGQKNRFWALFGKF